MHLCFMEYIFNVARYENSRINNSKSIFGGSLYVKTIIVVRVHDHQSIQNKGRSK